LANTHSLNFVFYIVNSGKLFVMESDTVTAATPLLNGVVVQAANSRGRFHQCRAERQTMVIYLTGLSPGAVVRQACPKRVRLLTATAAALFL